MKNIIEIWKPLSGTLKTVIVGVVLFLGYVIYKKTTTVIPTLKFSNVKSGQTTKEKTFLIKGKLTPANTVLYLSDSSLKKLPTQNGEFEYEASLPDSLNKVDFVIEYKDQKINRSVSIIREFSAEEIAQRKKELEEKIAKENKMRAAAERTELVEKQFSPWDGSHINLEKTIKSTMNDPASYEHVKTTYSDLGENLIVRTTFRGKNAFGGVVTNTIMASVDVNGNVIKLIK
jgi:hypothetical protein